MSESRETVLTQESATACVLVIEDDPGILALVDETLRQSYSVVTFQDARTALAATQRQVPDVVLLADRLPDLDGGEVCHLLRADPMVTHVPIIRLTARADVDDRVRCLEAGADDVLTKPFYQQELRARVASHLRRSRRERHLNPLTQLPGNAEVERAIQARMKQNAAFTLCSVDIDAFKAYNDRYGFAAGDRVIQLLADILCSAVRVEDIPTDMVGHLGGDDFLFLAEQERVVFLCKTVIAGFDRLLPQLYTAEDYRRGTVRVLNRRNGWDDYPLMRLSIAVVPIRPDSPPLHTTTAWLSQTTAEIKTYLKTQSVSRYLIDRRTQQR